MQIGKVGSGKSSLLSAILGEMEKIGGYVGVRGKTAYSSQQAWIQNMTLRDNILFDREYDQGLYKKVVDACELKRDLEILPYGDFTEIGEKGINLSGGQKARVSLARAIYQEADIYFLDDPLSAVDAIVGKSLFEKAIGPTGLLKDKTRLLVTHSLTFLKDCDLIVVLENGEITHKGTLDDLMEDSDVTDILKALEKSEEQKEEEENDAESETSDASPPGSILSARTSRVSKRTSHTKTSVKSDKTSNSLKKLQDAKMIKEEVAAVGRVSPRVYYSYFRAMNIALFAIFVGGMVFNFVSSVIRSFWLSAW